MFSNFAHKRTVWIATSVLTVLSGCAALVDDGHREIPKANLPPAFKNSAKVPAPADAAATVMAPSVSGETPPTTDETGLPPAFRNLLKVPAPADAAATVMAPSVSGETPPTTDETGVPVGADAPKPTVVPPEIQLSAPESQWWQAFHNDELHRLITEAMQNNHDLKVAVTRIAQAEETAVSNGAALYPTVTFDTKWTGSQAQAGLATGNLGTSYARIPEFTFQASYEADLWGKNKYSAESAYALAQASAHFREGVALTLASDITKSYVDVLAESDHVAVAENNLSNAKKSLESVRTRMDQGDATMVELLQQETTAANAEATVQIHRLNREKAFNKLAALMGTTPSFLQITGTTLKGMEPPDLSAGIPSQLLCRRPDIRRAEATLLSANADIKVARAKMYPDITFSLVEGRSSYSYTSWLLPESRLMSMVGDISQSVFSADKNASAVRQSEARYEEMVQSYHQTLVQAVHDVEDALAELRLTGEQRKALVKASGFARRAYEISTFSFDKHAIDFLSLLESQRSLYNTEDAEVSARADLMKASVDLFTALGGGLEAPHC